MYRRYRPYKNMFSPHQWRVLHSSPDWKMKLTRENSTVTATFTPRFSLNKDYSLEIEDVRNYDDLCEKVRDCYEEYDPDYETYLWKSSDGHGINGAPYHIRDILAEHDLIDSKLSGLLFALRCA